MLILFLIYNIIIVLAFVPTLFLIFRMIKLALACLRTKSYRDLIPTALWYLKIPFMISLASWLMAITVMI